MARYSTSAATAIYEAAGQWRDRCLAGEGSMFSDRQLWTPALLEEFKRCYVDQPLEGEGEFFEKFEMQIKSGSPELAMLAAEMLWVIYLFPERLIRGPLKREHIRRVWSWSGQPTLDQSELLTMLDEGIGNPGQGFNQYRWKEVVFFWLTVFSFKTAGQTLRTRILSGPWEFAAWIDGLEGSSSRLMRHILPHLLFPDYFERIASLKQKRKIATVFETEALHPAGSSSPAPGSLCAMDWQIHSIRRGLETRHSDRTLDFYESEDLAKRWSHRQPDPPLPADVSYAPPFDLLFEPEEASWVLNLFAQALGILKKAEGFNPRNLAITHVREGVSHRLRLNYGQWALLSYERKQDRGRFQLLVADLVDLPDYWSAPDAEAFELDSGAVRLRWVDENPFFDEEDQVAWQPFLSLLPLVVKRFLAQQQSSYRKYHRIELEILISNRKMREEILGLGLVTMDASQRQAVAPGLSSGMGDGEPLTNYCLQDALEELFMPREKLETILRQLARKKNVILQGAPGVGKTFLARRLAHLQLGCRDDSTIRMVQFHQSYTYEDFVEGIRPEQGGGFAIQPGILRRICRDAEEDPRDHFLIIDEINRGNLAKIFGELMMLVESDKRGESLNLAYSHEPFSVPKNLYIIGTMNTADRSLAMVDHALRRRFAFFSLEPGFEENGFGIHLERMGITAGIVARIRTKMRGLNARIEEMEGTLGAGYRIGHSFFTPSSPQSDAEQWYRDVVEHEILPLLAEYWMDSSSEIASHRKHLLDL